MRSSSEILCRSGRSGVCRDDIFAWGTTRLLSMLITACRGVFWGDETVMNAGVEVDGPADCEAAVDAA